ncbi:MAG TPA: prolipoprotein diacylglyceryl transferase family protein [Gemmatimonadaceae bacterium]|nr:prolipoprotein diacylglyceryl transferase family protein [Gemmatimonadaceae bacterium]
MIFAAPIVVHPFSYPVGPLELTGFGLAMFLGFVMAQIVVSHETARRGHDPDPVADLVFAAVVGGLLGAKLYYVILTRDPAALFQRAGFVYWGGLIGGAIAVLAMAKWKRIPLWQVADVAAPAVMAAYAIGRTGCWAVGDDYGLPWNGPWAVMFPNGAPPSTAGIMSRAFGVQFPAGTPPDTVIAVHPTQLYQVILASIFFFILWRLRDHKHAEGWLWGVFCVLAGVERFIVEFFRAKDDRFAIGLTTAQFLAIAFIIVGVVIMTLRSRVTGKASGIYARA